MMKKHKALLLLNVLCLSSMALKGMENPKVPQGPMDYEWFYDEENAYYIANRYYQQQDWQSAATIYQDYLNGKTSTEYDQNKARLNLASCLMAQGKATGHWAAFDALLNIPEDRRISEKKILQASNAAVDEIIGIENKNTDNKSVLVRTDQVGIGDIFHFLSAVDGFQNCTNWKAIVSVPNFLKETLASAAQEYKFTLIGAKDEQPATDYETHLISLLGHLKLTPYNMNPEKVVFDAPTRAIGVVLEHISPALNEGNTIAVVFLGENRQATLIGGKQLPRNKEDHGRYLDSEPFNALLKKHPNLTLLDCGGKTSRVAIDKDQEKQYMIIPDEQQAFDTIIALARIMSAQTKDGRYCGKRMIGFGSDMGPTNVFARSLDLAAQDRMTFVIPNPKEHDMRMNGKGDVYKQMISNCWVARCKTPSDQTRVIEESYHRMLTH